MDFEKLLAKRRKKLAEKFDIPPFVPGPEYRNPFGSGCYECSNPRVGYWFRYESLVMMPVFDRLCYDCTYEQQIGVD